MGDHCPACFAEVPLDFLCDDDVTCPRCQERWRVDWEEYYDGEDEWLNPVLYKGDRS